MQIPMEHEMLYNIKALISQLPALDSKELTQDALADQNTTLLITYLANITKGKIARQRDDR